ncbi:hypothetical protein [Paenibacillus elgii]|uniref:hypothetical protein n=1 Tax=Paenibacillus elgii TaxID=189691 RepID=UPI0013D4DDF7|nr:hypothetical protein [Paenibacillus elgii]
MKTRTCGIVLLVVSGLFYTIERIGAKIAAAIDDSSPPVYPGIFDNLFVWLFLLTGLILLGMSYATKKQ